MDEKPEKNALSRLKARTEAEEATAEVIRSETGDLSLRTIASVRAKFDAYQKVYKNYEKFILDQTDDLAKGIFKDSTYKELGVARLIAAWLVDTETFLLENEALMQSMEGGVKKRFIEESLGSFPENIRNELLEKLNEKKQELLIWFADELRLAREKTSKQKND